MGARFKTHEVKEWMGKTYTTVKEHLDNLRDLGILEEGQNKDGKFYKRVSDQPRGADLPSPAELRKSMEPEINDSEGGTEVV
ncbi:MAG: hypothetical protein O2913_02240 [Chloroflexi bacterium]|nr:hypothetical protein [Chloroflexota bacterium]